MYELEHQDPSDYCIVQAHLARDNGSPTQGQGRGMKSRRQIWGYKVPVAKTVSADLGYGRYVGVRWGLIKVSTWPLPWSLPGSSVAKRVEYGSYLYKVPTGAVSIPKKPVVSLFELKGTVLLASKALMFLISVGSSYICLWHYIIKFV